MLSWWLLVGLAIFLIGLTKSGFGSGAGLMIVPMTAIGMSHIPGYSAETALAMLLPLLAFGDVLAVWQHRQHFNKAIILRLLPGTAVGVALGSLLLKWFVNQQGQAASALVKTDIGLESVLLVCLHWYRLWRAKGQLPAYEPRIWKSTAVGAFSGVSSTIAHAAGPIIALHLLPQKLDRRGFVGTGAVYFFMVNFAKLPGYWKAGLLQKCPPLVTLRLAPLVLVGAIIGLSVCRKINDVVFLKVVYWITFLMGWYVLVDGVREGWPLVAG